jgi:regulator of RNase E activity RraB
MPYAPQKPAYSHQKKAFDAWGDRNFFALLMAMRCVDGNTEYLCPVGWRKISDYQGGKVAEFRLDGTAHFVEPTDYIKSPVDHFWHFKSQGAVDQVLSDNHRILYCGRLNSEFGKEVGRVPDNFRTLERMNTDAWRETSPRDLKAHGKIKANLPVTFNLKNSTKIKMTDDEIRLMVAFHADGTIGYEPKKKETVQFGIIRIKKERKINRLRELLIRMGIVFKEQKTKLGFVRFIFSPPRLTKKYGEEWWRANAGQRQIITEEVHHWDGSIFAHRSNGRAYRSKNECDVDFIQFCFASTGQRSSKQGRGADGCFLLHITGHGRTNNLPMLPLMKPYKEKHDGFMYSFSVPSTYLVFRRNGKVFVSGNTGKTKVTIDKFGEWEFSDQIDDLCVIAPAGVYETWLTAFKDHADPKLLARMITLTWSSSKMKSKAALKRVENFLSAADSAFPRLLLMNVEALSKVKGARELIVKFVAQRRCMVAVDESTTIKNATSDRTAFVIEQVAPIAFRKIILTGLPTPRSPLDAYCQFYFLDRSIIGFDNFTAFSARYATTYKICMLPTHVLEARLTQVAGQKFLIEGVGRVSAKDIGRDQILSELTKRGVYVPSVPVTSGYKNEDELNEKIMAHSYRVLLSDCYDLPPKIYMKRKVELTEDQERIYQELKTFATAELNDLGEHVTATHVMTRIMRLHQVLCGHTIDENGVEHAIKENRTKEVLNALEEYDGKAIIWCSYDHDVRKISEALTKEYGEGSVARFWGGNRATREIEEKTFKSEKNCRFMIATPDAGGRGRTWSNADLLIYYSSKNNLEHRAQSEERGDESGKMQQICCIDLVVEGTVDEKIIEALRGKIDMAARVTGDNWREWLI